MKEISIEEKAKAYDEAKLRMSAAYNSNRCTIGFMNEIFPELKESEDERIRKALIDSFNKLDKSAIWYNGITNGQILAWLEKLGEIIDVYEDKLDRCACESFDKGYKSALEKQGEQKSADNVEPKFHYGDWIVYNDNLYCIGNIAFQRYYECLRIDGTIHTFGLDIDSKSHFWTIQDAKNGDVLVASDNSIFLFAGVVDCACKYYVALKTDGAVKFNKELKYLWETSRAVHPATKKQRDLLFSKMKEAGYEWDAEKKELKKIELKTAWSEEDERIYKAVLELIDSYSKGTIGGCIISPNTDRYIKWLKSLKCRVKPKPKQEWNDEDERNLQGIIDEIEANKNQAPSYDLATYDKFLSWLKSLRPQKQWKPSDEQMETLEYYMHTLVCNHYKESLFSLYQDLEKLSYGI